MKKNTFSVFVTLTLFLFTGFIYKNATSSTLPENAAKVDAEAGDKQDAPHVFKQGAFEDPKVCSYCHKEIYEEWANSRHAKAWDNKWYQPDFLLAHEETEGLTDILCGACHAPSQHVPAYCLPLTVPGLTKHPNGAYPAISVTLLPEWRACITWVMFLNPVM